MKICVQMLAYGTPGEVREVEVPGNDNDCRHFPTLLEQVFRLGQNEFQPQPHSSVSIGDVIELGDLRYLITRSGFVELPHEEYLKYVCKPQTDRVIAAYAWRS